MSVDTGGQAFPQQETDMYTGEKGMTLLDYFAAKVLEARVKSISDNAARFTLENDLDDAQSLHITKTQTKMMLECPGFSYDIAEAMVAERKKRMEPETEETEECGAVYIFSVDNETTCVFEEGHYGGHSNKAGFSWDSCTFVRSANCSRIVFASSLY